MTPDSQSGPALTTPASPVLLLSDLHLPSEPSPYRAAFNAFLAGPARTASAVYILGDLFDAWIGDDIGVADFAPECANLQTLTSHGVPVGFLHGNRDFLVGERFAAVTGVSLLPDPSVVTLPDGPVLLAHGDTLCTDDKLYQRFRRIVHSATLQRFFLRLPIGWRRAIARRLRAGSRARKTRDGYTPAGDINADAVRKLLTRHAQTRLIHGHTHRPADHALALDGGTAGRRFVLADWRPQRMEYLACDLQGWHRRLCIAPIDPP
ncbi:MAG TPA: UDP-2,3-diacylglucosamine diphosphatase [Nevskiaceae bacterium]|nr:UDP-2,3-diacylglucosamine diphosphatase [Nevskiaceae bacterium]